MNLFLNFFEYAYLKCRIAFHIKTLNFVPFYNSNLKSFHNNFSHSKGILTILQIELPFFSDNTYNLYIEAKKYFSDARYNINLNGEEYIYIDKDPEKETYEEKPIELNKIKSIKHKINIPNEVEIKLKENQEIQERQENNSLTKTLLLLKYKEVVSNIERIEQFFFVFQTKGCSLPIEIEIIIKKKD